MEPSVRPFAEPDLPAVVALSLRAWEPVFDSMRRVLHGSGVFDVLYPDWRVSQSRIVERTCRSAERVWVCDDGDDGGPAGFVAAVLHPDERMGEIAMLAVDPAHQRRGIGSRLTAAATAWVAERGMTTVLVSTGGDPGHAPARATYERAGFTPVPIVNYLRTLP